jgi:hypothetical protein
MFSCARICIEVVLEKRILEAIKISLDDWTHIKKLDYEQIPFKFKMCQEYGHFARNCPKNKQEVVETEEAQEKGWKKVRKKANIG